MQEIEDIKESHILKCPNCSRIIEELSILHGKICQNCRESLKKSKLKRAT